MSTQDLQAQALTQYEDLRDTIMALEAMGAETHKPISWEDFKADLDA